jgi:hypothetical protein
MQYLSQRISHLLLGLAILFSSSSCTLHRLDVQTQYLTPEYLASYHIGTPDPRRYEALIGERLLVQWSLSAQEVQDNQLFLYLKVRFRDHQEQEVKVPITKKRGTYLYQVNQELFCQTGGILTYYAEIQSSSCVFASWKHPLWVELIKFNIPDSERNPQK